jgi:hypothetical protein
MLLVRLRFASVDDLRDRYARELRSGRLLVETPRPRPVGSPVSIVLEVAGQEQTFTLSGEVATAVGETDAAATGASPGMAIRLHDFSGEPRRRMVELIGGEPPPMPRAPLRPARHGTDATILLIGIEAQEFLAHTRTQDYYQLLGVDRAARAGEIRRSFIELTQRFHPDRYFRKAPPEVCGDLEDVYSSLAEAYETLMQNDRRARYDISIGNLGGNAEGTTAEEMSRRAAAETRRRSAPTHISRAEQLLAQALREMARGESRRAVNTLRLALAFYPEHPEVRAKLQELTGKTT